MGTKGKCDFIAIQYYALVPSKCLLLIVPCLSNLLFLVTNVTRQ